MAYELKLPDLGEGLTEGEVARWLVSEGQEVAEDERQDVHGEDRERHRGQVGGREEDRVGVGIEPHSMMVELKSASAAQRPIPKLSPAPAASEQA